MLDAGIDVDNLEHYFRCSVLCHLVALTLIGFTETFDYLLKLVGTEPLCEV